MIRSVRLQNFRSHKDSTLQFKEGTNVIVGAMGSGKSSIMDAISYGLFGTFPALASRKVTGDETILQKPNPMEFAKIELDFDYNHQSFKVERMLFTGKKSSEAKLYCNGRLVAGPKPGEVNAAIERELDVTYDLFSRAVYAEQNQLDFFLKLTPQERKQKFDELLQIDKYENARQNSQTLSNRLTKIAEDQKKWVAEQQKRIGHTNEKELLEKIEQKKIESANLETDCRQLGLQINDTRIKMAELEQAEHTFKKNSGETIRLQAKIQHLANQLQETQKKTGTDDPQKLKTWLEQTVLEQQKTTGEKERFERELETLREHTRTAQTQISLEENEVRREQAQFEQIQKLDGKCPTCQKPLDETHKKELGRQLNERQQQANGKIQTLQVQLQPLKQKQNELGELLRENQTQTLNLAQQLFSIQQLVRETTEAKTLYAELEITKTEFQKLQNELAMLSFDETALRDKRAVFLEQNTRFSSFTQRQKAAVEIIVAYEQQAELIQKTREQLTAIQSQTAQLDTAVEKLQLFSNSLKTVQSALRHNMVQAVNAAMADLWPRIYPYADFSTAQLNIVENGNYELVVQTQNGSWVRVEGILSGGERSAAALCIRMAFSLVLTQNLGWLILDEPTHNLDSKAVAELTQTLKHRIPELVPQLFIITHDNEMQKAASGTLYRIERDKGNDGVSQPVALAIEE